MTGFDWPGLLRLASHRVGLRPSEFWDLTPAEFVMLLGLDQGPQVLDRDRLEDLARAFPDEASPLTEGDKTNGGS